MPEDRCVTIDSDLMEDIMAQIGNFNWDINVIGTAQVNWIQLLSLV